MIFLTCKFALCSEDCGMEVESAEKREHIGSSDISRSSKDKIRLMAASFKKI